LKAFASIGLEKCFNAEFQAEAELHRMELGNLLGPVALIEESAESILSDEYESEVDENDEDGGEEEGELSDRESSNESNHNSEEVESVGTESGNMSVIDDDENPHIGRQVAVKFDGKPYPGVVARYTRETKKYAVEFDDEDDHSDVEFDELIFMD